MESVLYEAVGRLAEVTHALGDADLEQPYQWRAHREGVRFALLGTYHELRDLAVTLAGERAAQGPPVTRAQRALVPYHAAYRELQAVLLSVDDETYDQPPGPGEWPMRDVVGHIVAAERRFFTLVHYGIECQREEQGPSRLPEGYLEQVMEPSDEFRAVVYEGTLQELLGYYEQLHRRALTEFSAIGDEELQAPSLWWEGEELSLQYRLHRFDAHLRQHTIQAVKTLAALGRRPTEAAQLLRDVYEALAGLESVLIGAPGLGAGRREALADTIAERAQGVAAALEDARQMVRAVQQGNAATVRGLLEANPRVAGAVNGDGLPVVMEALYRGQEEIARTLHEAGPRPDIFAAAALGRLDLVREMVGDWSGYVNDMARDGFTPLQLACYFGREEVALWLMEHGADVHARAQNSQQIQAIHAAAANGSTSLLRALLARGADVNARQQQAFTPLHTAADRGDVAMAEIFLSHGADVQAADSAGRTALDLAREKKHEAMVALLSEQAGSAQDDRPRRGF